MTNCDDGSDEDTASTNCLKVDKSEDPTAHSTYCLSGYMECKNAENQKLCAKKCDGVKECRDEKDEEGCNNPNWLTASETPKSITSPNYPHNYPNNLRWYRVIKTHDTKKQVQLKVHDVRLEAWDSEYPCMFDFLLWTKGVIERITIMRVRSIIICVQIQFGLIQLII